MTAPRALWKGFMKLGNVTFGVKLIGAVSEAERIHFRILNRETREPVKSAYIDEVTGEQVATDDQVKGYEVDRNEYLLVDPEEIASLKLESEHLLTIDSFVDKTEVDPIYFDKPYYLIPADSPSAEAFATIREAMTKTKKAGLATVVLFQRERHVVIEPIDKGMLLTTLHKHKEIVPAERVFGEMKDHPIDPEMTDIATMIIDKKVSTFDPSKFEDAYEYALQALIDSKRTGKPMPKSAPAPKETTGRLAEVLRKSLEAEGLAPPKGKKPKAKSPA